MGRWVEIASFGDAFPCGAPSRGLFVNRPNLPDLGTELVRSLAAANRSIDLINPLVTDETMTAALIAARQRGVRIRIVTELRENRGGGVGYPTRGFEASDQVLNDQFQAVRRLASEGIVCRALVRYSHAKLMIVDGAAIAIGSCNWNGNSLGWGPRPSLEAGLRIEDPRIVGGFAAAFDAIWKACPFRLRQLGDDVSLQQEPARPVADGVLDRELTETCSMAWTFPPHGRALRDELVRLVDAARQRLVLITFSFYDVHEVPRLDAALHAALARGVAVAVVVRPGSVPPDQDPDPGTRGLMARGLRLYGTRDLHAKGALADDRACAIFSANINPYSLDCDLVSANVECGLFECGGIAALSDYADFVHKLAEHPTHEYRV